MSTSSPVLARSSSADDASFHGRDPGALWLGWEAPLPRISEEEKRSEAEGRYAEIIALDPGERRPACDRFGSASLIEILLEKSAGLLLQEQPEAALATARLADDLAQDLGPHRLAGTLAAVYQGRAKYLAGTALRLLGHLADAESAFLGGQRFLSWRRRSLDRAFWCRGLAMLRWETGGLDEAGALLERAATRFAAARQEKEAGATYALLGLLAAEEGARASATVELRIAKETMDLEQRPWLSVRACLALALLLAERKKLDPSLVVLQEFWRLKPHLTGTREEIVSRWWEGRAQARLGNHHDAAWLLRHARLKYLEERRVPEAALVTLDVILASTEAGRRSQADEAADEFESWLGREDGADVARAVLRQFQSGASTSPAYLRRYAVERAAFLRRWLRAHGFRIDPLPCV